MSGYTYSQWFSDEEIMADMERHVKAMHLKWEEYERRKRELPKDLTPTQYTEAIRALCQELNI